MLSVVILSVVMLSVVMLSVFMLSVVAPRQLIIIDYFSTKYPEKKIFFFVKKFLRPEAIQRKKVVPDFIVSLPLCRPAILSCRVCATVRYTGSSAVFVAAVSFCELQ